MSLITSPSRPLAPASVPEAVSRFIESRDGTRLHVYTVGEGGPAMVFCDGLGCDGYVWKYLVEDLAPRHRLVRFHYRGHGRSDPPADRSKMRVSDLCDDLLSVLDAEGLEKAVLFGHSLGVQVILEFHRRHPERVLAMVPVCGSYGRPLDTFHDAKVAKYVFPVLRRIFRRFPSAAQKAWSIADTELAYQVALRTEVNGELVRREDFRPYLSHLGNMDVQLFMTLLADAAEHDALLHLQDIDVPTLIVAGTRDGFTPYWLSAVMHARIPNSELLTVPLGTHTAPIEDPELVCLRVRRFLDERVLPLEQEQAA